MTNELDVPQLADELRIVIQKGLRPSALQRRASEIETLLLLNCVGGDTPTDPLYKRCQRLVDVLRIVLRSREFGGRMKQGLEMWFGATDLTSLLSAAERREKGYRLINPSINESTLVMSSKTILERHEGKYRDLVARQLEKYEIESVNAQGIEAGTTLRPPGNRSIEAIPIIRSGQRRFQRDDPLVGIDDFVIEHMYHLTHIDASGNATVDIHFKVINVSKQVYVDMEVPVWSGDGRPVADVTSGHLSTVVAAEWDPGEGGFFLLPFEKPVQPGHRAQVRYRFHLPDAFSEGDEWFEWYFGRACTVYRKDITFDPIWTFSDLRASCPSIDDIGRISFTDPTLDSEGIHWQLPYPSRGHLYRLDWSMERR